MVLKNKDEQKYTNNQLLEEVAENLQKIPFELQRKETVAIYYYLLLLFLLFFRVLVIF